jgi:23S rRNA pseudouridine2605 synthase
MRLARFLARAGVASRRAAEELIRAGRVSVNGRTVETPATVVEPASDTVSFDGRPLRPATQTVTVMLHKPPGYTCTAHDPHAERLVGELLPPELGRVFTIGRLDCASEGLLLCTNDGDLAFRCAHPRYGVRKTYRVVIATPFAPERIDQFCEGAVHNGERLAAAEARLVSRDGGRTEIELVLTEGKKREIRRLCACFGLKVARLLRIAYGPLELGDLPTGRWRHLQAAELRALHSLVMGTPRPSSRPTASPPAAAHDHAHGGPAS